LPSGITDQRSYNDVVNYATTIYIKNDITTIGSYITDNFTPETSDREGYTMYVKK